MKSKTPRQTIIPPSRLSVYLVGRKVAKHTKLFFAGALDAVLTDIIGNVKEELEIIKRTRVTPECIRLAISKDPDLTAALGHSFVSQGGWQKTHAFGIGKMRRTIKPQKPTA